MNCPKSCDWSVSEDHNELTLHYLIAPYRDLQKLRSDKEARKHVARCPVCMARLYRKVGALMEGSHEEMDEIVDDLLRGRQVKLAPPAKNPRRGRRR